MNDKCLISSRRYGHSLDILNRDGPLLGHREAVVKAIQMTVAQRDDSRVGPVLTVQFGHVSGVDTFGVSVNTLVAHHLQRNGKCRKLVIFF